MDEYREQQRVIGEWMTQSKDAERFRYKPWQAYVLTSDELRSQISRDFAERGFWQHQGELRMGAGATVRLEPSESTNRFRVSAECGIKISGEYDTLDGALAAASLFADVVWGLAMHGGTEGFVWPQVSED